MEVCTCYQCFAANWFHSMQMLGKKNNDHIIANLLFVFTIKSNHTFLRKLLLSINFMFDELLLRIKRRKNTTQG
jgi:hypothetical protein